MDVQKGAKEEQERREALSREMLAILDGIELLVKQLVVAARQAAVYAKGHPVVKEYTGKAYETVKSILRRKEEFSISIREDLLVYENIPLYQLSLNARRFISMLEEKKIGGMTVKRGVSPDELVQFVRILVALPDELESRDSIERELEHRGVRNIKVLEPVEEEAAKKEGRRPKEVYKAAVRAMRRITRSIIRGSAIDVKEVDELVADISQAILDDRETLLALTSIKNYDETTFTHSVNVCVLAVALASLLTKDRKVLNRIGQAALLHDVGKTVVPREIISKPGDLTEEEIGLMRRHPLDGAKILEETEGTKPLSVVVAFEHHRQCDGEGYPPLERSSVPHPISLLVQIADVYDALISPRPYGRQSSPEGALAEMAEGTGKAYEPRLLKEFVGMMGIFPPGTAVELTTGEIALVRSVNRKNLLRPVVKIIKGSDGAPVAPPLVVDLDGKDERTGECPRSIVRSLETGEVEIDKLLFIEGAPTGHGLEEKDDEKGGMR